MAQGLQTTVHGWTSTGKRLREKTSLSRRASLSAVAEKSLSLSASAKSAVLPSRRASEEEAGAATLPSPPPSPPAGGGAADSPDEDADPRHVSINLSEMDDLQFTDEPSPALDDAPGGKAFAGRGVASAIQLVLRRPRRRGGSAASRPYNLRKTVRTRI